MSVGLLAWTLASCNVQAPANSTGGVDFKALGSAAGAAGNAGQVSAGGVGSIIGVAAGTRTCERGLVVVTSDYQSTNIAITKLDGTPLSPSFISSGASKPGLSLALSGDVQVPRVAPASDRVVLLDRFGTNVVTWMDLESAAVTAQLAVGTGFESNPQDYLEFSGERAVLSRFGSNPTPGQLPYDAGGDLLILDTRVPSIIGRIAMPEEDPALLPRPSGLTPLGDAIVVNLQRLSPDFTRVGLGRFVGVSAVEQRLLWSVDIPGLSNCGRLVKSPSSTLGAVACSSPFNRDTYRYDPEKSDVVLYDLTVTPPSELRRLGLAKTLDAGLQATLEFASETKLIALTYGGNSSPGDSAVAVDIATGTVQQLLAIATPYALGGVHCVPGCGDICVIADASTAKLRRFKLTATGDFQALEDISVDNVIGLPPRAIGAI